MRQKLLFLFLLITAQLVSQNPKQSIGFKENKGQIIDQNGEKNDAVKYLLNSNGLNVQLKKNGFSYDVYELKKTAVDYSKTARKIPYSIPGKDEEQKPEYHLEYIFHRIDIDFIDSNSKVELIADQKSIDFDNYYNTPNNPEGTTKVYQYKQITYKNIYPNIDIVFTIPKDPQKTVEYNFIIHPKGKISDIKLKFNGAETDLVDNKIQMNVRFGKMEETLPASWIEEDGYKKEITVGYKKLKKNIYGFSSSHFSTEKTVIIDPVPVRLWGTYYGGEEFDYATSIFTKGDFVYMAGVTYSKNNIASTGAFQNTFTVGGAYDAFFTKFTSDGTRIWGTYYGGNSIDEILKIKVSNNNKVFIVGKTLSPTNIATALTHQPVKSGYYDGFIAKFDSDGAREWGTYYGGLFNDAINSISIDNNENFYISGDTSSKENISSIGSHQVTAGNLTDSSTDGFIAKFDSNGMRQWASYYGGSNFDVINDSEFDSNGDLIFLGYSRSTNNIATQNSFQQTNTKDDGFLVKFTPNGSRLWATYFGGDNNDYFFYLGLDSNDNIYCFGRTDSQNNISSPDVFQRTYIPNSRNYSSGCIFKFDSNGQKIWGSYFFPETLGGSVSKDGFIYFTGRTEHSFQPTPNVFQETPNSGTESYLVKFNTNGQREWATYFGGEMADNALLTCIDNNLNIYLAGTTNSKTNIATPGTFQENLTPDPSSYQPNIGDAFLVKFRDCQSYSANASSNSPICIGKTLELKASGGTNYSWSGPNGFTSTDQNPTIVNASTINSGEYSCLITGTGGCDDTKKINVIIGDNEAPIPVLATLPTITGDCNTTVTTIPTANDACAGVIIATTTNPLSYALPGTYTIVWNYNDGNGNSSTQNQTVTITSQPLPTANSPQTFCVEQNATLNDIQITGQNIKWYSNLTNGTLVSPTTVAQDKTTYYASQTINGCESERVPVTINIQVTSPPTGNANQSFCTVNNSTISNIEINGSSIKWYDAPNNGSLLTETTTLENGKTYYASQTLNNCEGPRFGVTVSIVNTPTIPTGTPEQSFCKKENKTLNDIQITGQNIMWFDTSFSAAALPNTTLLENNRTYYASQTIGCESDRTPILVHVYDTPLPIGNNNQQFCIDKIASIEDLNISGTALKWYDSAANGNLLSETALLQNGVYYVTQTLNNCESERLAIKIKIQDTPIPIADSPQQFCIQESAKISDIAIRGQSIKWYESSSTINTLSESTSLENGITYYATQTIDNCESDRIPLTINILEVTNLNCINLALEIPYPQFFTPNDDGFNDTWTLDPAYLAPNSSIRIFNRYGKLLKELSINGNWDGTYVGQLQPATDYWFTATKINGAEFRGHFTLKR
ncbi:T9SS type B sorting domain-containing protein [Flavobacterium sp. 17A]|uniref:T9SS type B sorting domain-containing protein n=1 Tax=Flavobacterium potami TaxID=2872310 RepID=A0A9X1H6U0_9FLAO|nr:T9SS type B sorting domain-containing protein [Flavobacterium potami]MBZ4033237.1 T9SS type B sorting domain-containing protein [Flavobacterium potami]